MEGFFRIAFTGNAGSGFGVVVLCGGTVAGADVAGTIYDGVYTENPATGELGVQVNVTAPAGVTPVQTGVPLTESVTYPIDATLTSADIANETPVLLRTPLGPVNAIFKKLRDLPETPSGR